MNTSLKNKAIGYYLALIAAVICCVGLVRFLGWAPAHKAMDQTIVCALIAGIVFTVILFFKDASLLVILTSAAYAYALIRHLTNQAGSFVDAYQGIVMFGDSSQVGTILQIAALMGAGLVLVLISSFMRREKA